MLFSWQLQNGPQDFDFSIAMGADFSFYVKSIATYAPAFLMYNNSVLARVQCDQLPFKMKLILTIFLSCY